MAPGFALMSPKVLSAAFFDQTPLDLAPALLGKVLRHRDGKYWLSARIIETEAYRLDERGSHSSLGRTPSRAALFDPPGTIYMYYARGKDSLNFSAQGEGNGVLVKSAYPVMDDLSPEAAISAMQRNNPGSRGPASRGPRPVDKLCKGQTLTCRALGLSVTEWNRQMLDPDRFRLDDDGYRPSGIIQCRRLGIPPGRDEHLPWRFIDTDYAKCCTSNPLTKRGAIEGADYWRL